MEDRRQLVHEISQCPEDAPKILSSLTRKELLEIICAEMGEERKYSGYTKFKMIDHLLKLVSCKSNTDTGPTFKRQRTQEYQCQPSVQNDEVNREMGSKTQVLLCHNLVCRASLERDDVFCKRCSCCICHQYDDNKDPSLWLTCDSDSQDETKPCGLSCHLKCALEHEQSGILKNCINPKLDGDFYCVSCGKINGIMRYLTLPLTRYICVFSRKADPGMWIVNGSSFFFTMFCSNSDFLATTDSSSSCSFPFGNVCLSVLGSNGPYITSSLTQKIYKKTVEWSVVSANGYIFAQKKSDRERSRVFTSAEENVNFNLFILLSMRIFLAIQTNLMAILFLNSMVYLTHKRKTNLI